MEQGKLPYVLQEPFFLFLNHQIDEKEFSEWLYSNEELEGVIEDAYLDLLAIDFSRGAVEEVKEIMSSMLDFSEFEKKELFKLLDKLLLLGDDYPKLLKLFYDLYIPEIKEELVSIENSIYSLSFEIGVVYDDKWKDYSYKERENIVSPFYEGIKRAVAILKEFLIRENPLKGDLIKEGRFPYY